MNAHYILINKKPVPEPNLMRWGHWFKTENRIVRKDHAIVTVGGQPVGTVEVSTIFLGLDHSFGSGPPLLFETMVFGGPLDQEMDRYATWEEAEIGHERMCNRIKHCASPVRRTA